MDQTNLQTAKNLPNDSQSDSQTSGNPVAANQGLPTSSPKKFKILIVEDDPILIKMYKAKFIKEGFEVLAAEDGEAGLKLALETRDLSFIILDIMMPKLSGIDLLRQLRQHPERKNIPVLVLSNLAQPKEAEEIKSLGVKELLLKANLTPSQIVAKVREYLS